MKKIIITLLALVFAAPIVAFAQPQFDEDAVVDSLLTINEELRTKFPRWQVCEPDLQYQIYQAFKILKFPPSQLDLNDIEVLAAPRSKRDAMKPYEILLISCGSASMNSHLIESQIPTISRILSGANKVYDPPQRGDVIDDPRAYCYTDIPKERPPKPSEAEVIVEWLRPNNQEQAITLSLFEQSLKVGKTGFWLNSKVGNDQVGYPFWTAGENKIVMSRPLYDQDPDGKRRFWELISYHIGAAYRIQSGTGNETDIFSWLPQRQLNSEPNGKIIGGMEVYMPFEQNLGVRLNLELPYQDANNTQIDDADFVIHPIGSSTFVDEQRQFFSGAGPILGVVPVLRHSGQLTAFYNLWLNEDEPENFFRFEAGLNFTEVQEYLAVNVAGEGEARDIRLLDAATGGVSGVRNYSHVNGADMIFLKATYRNQAENPFEFSAQLSNSILSIDGYLPLFGNWFLLQGKYATPVRDARYYEFDNFFMISPVLRITL